jgi:L-alanine-DL-glutamate epimerase-like enolase superfamily enzyme
LKITEVKATALKTRSVIVQIFTDEGINGIGECSPMNLDVLANFVNKALAPIITGEDPLEIDKLWNLMFFRTYKLGPHGVQPEAISGVDIALWDILGKVAGLPVCKLLGASYRDRILMYASIGGGAPLTPDEMVRKVDDALHKGFKAIKIRMDWGPHRRDTDPAKDLAMFKAVRKLVGDDIPLSFDANNGYSVTTAIQQGRKFEELGIYHFEEPVAQYDYAGIRQVTGALDVPVSAGEHEYTRWQFRDLIEQANPDILQPDVVKCGGITEMKKISVLSETYSKHFLPHQTQPTIGTLASLHVCNSIQTCTRPHEFTGQRDDLNELFEEPLEFKDGYITMPDKPGLGLELIQSKLEEFAL